MRRVVIGIAMLSLALASAAGAAPSKSAAPADSLRRAAVKEGWPDSRVGELAYGWVTAFSSGEVAMRDYLAKNLAPKSLEDKSVPQRIERYRDLHEQYGKLELTSVVKTEPEKLTVKLMSSDAKQREFIFTAQGEAPFKLVSVAIRESGHFGHGGFGH